MAKICEIIEKTRKSVKNICGHIKEKISALKDKIRKCSFKRVAKQVLKRFDLIVASIGLVAIAYFTLIKPAFGICDCVYVSYPIITILAILGSLQIVIIFKTFCAHRPKFDWHLVYGNFLMKVVSIVVLVPFIIAPIAIWRGFPEEHSTITGESSLIWNIFAHYVDPGNIVNVATNQVGLATLIALLGVVLLNGLLIASLIGWLDNRKAKWLNGDVEYDSFLNKNEHYIIIGGNDMVAGIVEQIFNKHDSKRESERLIDNQHIPYIVIQTSRDVEEFRMELFSNLTESEQRHIIIYYGNRTSTRDIEKLKVRQAKEVYIIGEDVRSDDIESYHDTMNMKCLELIREHLGEGGKKLTCYVMFEYQTTFSVFQYSEISNNIKDCIDFKPFNYYDSWAQQVLIGRDVATTKSGYLPLEGANGIDAESDKHVHLIIVGMSRMGVSMAINAAHVAHYPNFGNKGIRTKITFIDKAADEEKDFFMGRFKELFALSCWRYGNVEGEDIKWDDTNTPSESYKHLGGDFLDIEWEFINGSIGMKAMQKYISDASKDENSIVNIAICLPEPNRCLAAALYLERDVYYKVNQILVFNRYGDSLVAQMTHEGVSQINPYHNKMRAFGMAYRFYDLELMKDIAYIAEINGKAYKTINKSVETELGKVDEGKKIYGKSEVSGYWSNFYSGSTAWCKLRCIGFDGEQELTSEQVDTLAKVEHARWNTEQLLMGYRPLTEEEQKTVHKDMRLKTPYKSKMAHLDICSFERLMEIDKRSIKFDEGFSKILPLILNGLKAARRKITEEELKVVLKEKNEKR